MHINLSGWVNSKKYIRFNFNEYLVAYSSHSNFAEMENFVKIINPGHIEKIVVERPSYFRVKGS